MYLLSGFLIIHLEELELVRALSFSNDTNIISEILLLQVLLCLLCGEKKRIKEGLIG
jgi:hypothetical protein